MFQISKVPQDHWAFTNLLYLNSDDAKKLVPDIKLFYAELNVANSKFLFTCTSDPTIASKEIGTNLLQRKWMNSLLGQSVEAKVVSIEHVLTSLSFEISLTKRQTVKLDSTQLSTSIAQLFKNHTISVNQPLIVEYQGINMILTARELQSATAKDLLSKTSSQTNTQFGILQLTTEIQFSPAPDCGIQLTGQHMQHTKLIQPNFKFEELGIGGLDNEFAGIFRRAFASRIFPPSIIDKLGIQHVKGILLFGPPGTGKTLMARQIGKMLNAKEPIIVNGPEILNKFVGQSEENVRKLFAAAEAEYKEKGEASGLHIIIFDELDAICRQRGGKQDGTGVGDSIVNQLLAKMDGVEQLNNILLIGMTNRKELIDEALLRPGRLEVHMEIGLPDEAGRLQILKIHTTKMTNNKMLGTNVDLKELSQLTKNFSGAEINGLVRSATSFAFNRHVKVGEQVKADLENILVEKNDFLSALNEVQAAFGSDEVELSKCFANGVISLPASNQILSQGELFVKQVRESTKTPLVSLLLHGPPGTGKTALAAKIASLSDFPYIKFISSETMVGYNEQQKIREITKIFEDSYKSNTSVIVVDCIERLLGSYNSCRMGKYWAKIFEFCVTNVARVAKETTTKKQKTANNLHHLISQCITTNGYVGSIYYRTLCSANL
eukprot:NODE_38_length_35257_cov_0.939047.p3 type:complete len:663 gc:universal NODE_38_length_35257_cov_0.939047:5749-7737(+)